MDTVSVILYAVAAWSLYNLLMGVVEGYRQVNTILSDNVREKISKLIHAVKEEQHGEHKYWFDAETDEFLGQGATHDDIIEVVKKRYHGHVFIFDKFLLAGPTWKLEPVLDVESTTELLNKSIIAYISFNLVKSHSIIVRLSFHSI